MSDTATTPTTEEREARIRDQILSVKERQVAAVLRRMDDAERREKKLRESWDWEGFRSLDLIIDRVRASDSSLPGHAPISTVNDRRWGHNWPFWRTWQEHAGLRAGARMLEGLSSLVPGALRGLQSYVIGTGYTYRSTSKDEAPKALVDACQDIIDEFQALNNWSAMEKEGFYRSRRDGELLHEHEDDNGRLMVDVVEPEEVYPPAGDSMEWSYGILTRGRKTHRPLAYSLIDRPELMETRTYPAEDILHFKCNVDARIKRGKTDLCYDTADIFRTAGRLADHIGVGSAIQASIALIRQHEGADQAAVRDFAASPGIGKTRDVMGNTEDLDVYEAGRIIDINAGQTYIPPPFAQNVEGHLGVVKGILQCVAVRWNAPEWLVSADASNNNYASSITAESPFVKRCYSEQVDYKAFYLRSVWAAVKCAADAGRIRAAGKAWTWEEIRSQIDIQVEAPNIEVRDDAKTATTDKTYIEAGVKSVQTTQQELGLDTEQEAINIRHWQRETGQDADRSKTNDLTAPTLLQLQQAYYSGQLPRPGAVANVMLVFGLSQQQAEALFPGDPKPQQPPTPPGPGVRIAQAPQESESPKRRKRRLREAESGWDEGKHQRADDGRFGSGGGHDGGDKKGKDKPEPPDQGDGTGGTSVIDKAEAEHGSDWNDLAGETPVASRLVKSDKARKTARAAFGKKVSKFFGGMKDGIVRAGTKVYDAMPKGIKHFLDVAHGVGGALGLGLAKLASGLGAAWGYVEHKLLNPIKHGFQALAKEVARERKLPEEHVEKLGSVLAVTDTVYAWTANIPLAHEILHHTAHIDGFAGFGLAKLAFFLPLGSLAYCAYSLVRNPAAMVRAAANVLERAVTGLPGPGKDEHHKESAGTEPAGPLLGKALADALAQRLVDAGDQHDWYHALFCSAFDRTHDARRSLALADQAFAKVPSGDELASKVTPEEYASVLDDYEPPAVYRGGAQGGRESEWSEDKHQRADDGRFGSGGGSGDGQGGDKKELEPGTKEHYKATSEKVKARHAKDKQDLQAEHRERRAEIHAKHGPARAEIQASLKAKVAEEKAKGKEKLRKAAGRQKKLRAKQESLKAQLAASEQATEGARQAVDEAREAGGYLGELLGNELADPSAYTARELGEECLRLNGEHPWDPAQDPDWNQTDYDETTDSEVPTHTPEETRAETARRSEAKGKLKELGMKLLAHARAESRGDGLDDKIEAIDDQIGDLDDKRGEHVSDTNERINAHREKHAERHEQVKEKLRAEKDDLRGEYEQAYEMAKDDARAKLEKAKDAHRTAKQGR